MAEKLANATKLDSSKLNKTTNVATIQKKSSPVIDWLIWILLVLLIFVIAIIVYIQFFAVQ